VNMGIRGATESATRPFHCVSAHSVEPVVFASGELPVIARLVPAAVLLALLAAPALTQEGAGRPLPFSDDRLPPPALPSPLDRHFKGELVEFDGERITLHWDWSDGEQIEDFDAFVPVRKGLRGGFTIAEGRITGRGTAGLRVRLGFLADVHVATDATLTVPHDLGIVLSKPDVSDESILCLVQDRFFTKFDAAAGNANMINKMGGIPATAPGVTEFRYVDRKQPPKLARGDHVTFDVIRAQNHTKFVITPDGEAAVALGGADPDTAMTHFSPGLYVSGGAAEFGPLTIDGAIDPDWCASHDVLPHIAGNLLHPGNRFKGAEKKAASLVERFLAQGPDTPEKRLVSAASVAALVGKESLPLVIRIRAAESLTEKGLADGSVAEPVTQMLDGKDRPSRLLAWQVLRPQLPWHFRYDPDGPKADRREAALLIADYFQSRDDAIAQGKIFVDGYWQTPSRADAQRGEFETAWDWRSPRIRVRTNMKRVWAIWYFNVLEAAYAELVTVVGQEPPPEQLPLSILLFDKPADFKAFCEKNGYAEKAEWGRFVDLEKNCAFVTFEGEPRAPYWAVGQLAKLFLRRSSGRYWPVWYDEGRCSWFGNPTYQTSKWDGETLTVGVQAEGYEAQLLRAAAHGGDLEQISHFMARHPRALNKAQRRTWYAHAWALHHWFMTEAPEDVQKLFGRWLQDMQENEFSPKAVDKEGRRLYHTIFAGQMEHVDELFLSWAKTL